MTSESGTWRLIADRWSRFHVVTLYRWIERVQRISAEFENLKGRLGPALDHKPCSLARWTRSIRMQQDGAWKGIGGIIIGILVSMLQTRLWRLQVFKTLCSYLPLSFQVSAPFPSSQDSGRALLWLCICQIAKARPVVANLDIQNLKCTCHQKIAFNMWKGHILEVHCTNIQRNRFIE